MRWTTRPIRAKFDPFKQDTPESLEPTQIHWKVWVVAPIFGFWKYFHLSRYINIIVQNKPKTLQIQRAKFGGFKLIQYS